METVKISKGNILPGGMLSRAPAHIRIDAEEPYCKAIPQAVADFICDKADHKGLIPNTDQIVYIVARLESKSAFRQAHGVFGIEIAKPDLKQDITGIYEELRLQVQKVVAEVKPGNGKEIVKQKKK